MSTAEIALPASSGVVARGASQATAVEQVRAVAEVAAAVQVAQQNPRDITRAIEQMRQACRQPALAERAFYSLPRGGSRIEGSTVHLARELARCWGNVDYGIRELRRDDDAGVSEMQAWAWDQEQNVRSSRSFVVPHARMVGRGADKKREALIDLGDIANNNNSVAARAVRETIFTVVPPWFRVEAETIAAHTLQDGGGKTLAQQVADAVAHYGDSWNVTATQLEERLARPRDRWTSQDVGLLRVLSGELSRGEKRVEEEFPQERVTAAEITSRKAAPLAPVEPSANVDTTAGEITDPEPSGLDEFHPDTTHNPNPEPATDDGTLPLNEPPVDPPITGAQSKMMHALLNENGLGDRDTGLAWIGAKIGREIDTSKDLTKAEASQVIDALNALGGD